MWILRLKGLKPVYVFINLYHPCPSFKLASNAGQLLTNTAKISEKFEENALRIYEFSAGFPKFPEDLRLTLLGEYRFKR